jgi:hypothetical protein
MRNRRRLSPLRSGLAALASKGSARADRGAT